MALNGTTLAYREQGEGEAVVLVHGSASDLRSRQLQVSEIPAYLLRLTDRLEQLLPNVERVEIAGASHAMQEEKPDVVNEAITGSSAPRCRLGQHGRRLVQHAAIHGIAQQRLTDPLAQDARLPPRGAQHRPG